MRVLFIVHATAWSDKASTAKPAIQRLISQGDFDQILEIVQSHFDIKSQRYVTHSGLVFEHEEISPVRFFSEELFGENPLFPMADAVTLVGGVFNSSEGCLNVAFEHMLHYYKGIGRPSEITIPISATYRAKGETWEDSFQVEQCVKDLAWRLLRAEMPFLITLDDVEITRTATRPLMRLRIEGH